MRSEWFERLERALAEHEKRACSFPELLPAAVLVPLLDGPDGVEVLLTIRSSDLEHHPGQIAFPGGRVDAGETTLQAALRETQEEVGLHVAESALLGALCCHPSPAGYCAEPFVARLPWPQPLTLLPREVADTFTVPLNHLLALEPTARAASHGGLVATLHAYQWQQYSIWGLTGNVLHELLEVIRGSVGSAP